MFVSSYEFVARNNTLTEIKVSYLYLMNAKIMLQVTHSGAPFGDGPASAGLDRSLLPWTHRMSLIMQSYQKG